MRKKITLGVLGILMLLLLGVQVWAVRDFAGNPDRAEVFGTGNGDLLRVKLYLKGGPDGLEYTVRRVRGGASVCTRRYI